MLPGDDTVLFHEPALAAGGVPMLNCTAGGDMDPTEARDELEPTLLGGMGTDPLLAMEPAPPGDWGLITRAPSGAPPRGEGVRRPEECGTTVLGPVPGLLHGDKPWILR